MKSMAYGAPSIRSTRPDYLRRDNILANREVVDLTEAETVSQPIEQPPHARRNLYLFGGLMVAIGLFAFRETIREIVQ